ncbi:MAG: pectinesterase [Deltaproteobacteria bacterium]|nr:pectinesterase [Deltaproteobacteria bacterium]
MLVAATLLTACGGTAEVTPDNGPPLVPDLPQGWTEIKPGGETICSRGTEFSFWVRPGKVNKLVIEFIGGGACWNQLTCSIAGQIFSPDVEDVREAVAENMPVGIYDHENPDNPVADWHHVIVPYCTGDIHWGDAFVNYGGGVSIHHRGATNAKAVLEWVYAGYAAPETILVTGCSAGSYGSAMWAPYVAEHYASSRLVQMGDSGAGIVTKQFFDESFPNWNAEATFPSWIATLDPTRVDVKTLSLVDLYATLSNHYGQHRFSQYTTAFDDNQRFYYEAMGGKGSEWSELMFDSIAATEERASAFGSFIAPGEQHCILGYENFYTVNVGGVRFVDWLREYLDGASPADVSCGGDDCKAATP